MAKNAYVGVSGVARKVKQPYVGVSGVARKVKEGYVGVNGVARLFHSSFATYKRYKIINYRSDTTYGSVGVERVWDEWSGNTINRDITAPLIELTDYGTAPSLTLYYASVYSFDVQTGLYTLGGGANYWSGYTINKSFTNSSSPMYFCKGGGATGSELYYFPTSGAAQASIYTSSSSYTDEYGVVVRTTKVVLRGTGNGSTNPMSGYTKFSATKLSTPEIGAYVDTIIAQDGAYPDNGISGNYWYVKQ